MAIDSFMVFKPYNAAALKAESQVALKGKMAGTEPLATDSGFAFKTFVDGQQVFEVEDYSFDTEQQLNIGSQSSGTGAGKVTFNPFSITRKIDLSSPFFFQMHCAGTPFETVYLCLRKSAGTADQEQSSGLIFLRYDFKMVAIKTISWSHDDEAPKETMTFEYGGLQIRYTLQKPDGSMDTVKVGGWNRVRNTSDVLPGAI
ncbi:MAG TPA: type VI secretion system tube protein Hcp [Stellaceae bacterium]|nr:type VI secretion system tube protein Hcp [Stellaceae bacterium]